MATTRTRIVVTGMGAVSSLGHDVDAMWQGLIAGRCGIAPLTRLDASQHRIAHGGEVPPLPEDAPDADDDLAIRYVTMAGAEALDQAGLADAKRKAVGLVLGSNFGAMAATEKFLAAPSANTVRGAIFPDGPIQIASSRLGLGGPCAAVSLSCASGNGAIGHAADLLRSGQADAVLAVGYDAISELVWAGLAALRAMTTKELLPFDSRRSGTIFAEGAGALLLETEPHALARKATPLVEFLGYGTSSNAFHMTHPDAGGEGMARAMQSALADAGIEPEEVDHVNAHATGTPTNDPLETAAIKTVFGNHASHLVVNGLKAMLGHAMGAASALEAVATVMTIREGIVPPTLGLDEPDPACDLDCVPCEARQHDVRAALNNAAGFGGCNAATVFRRWEASP